MTNKRVLYLTQAAMIAALYVVLTLFISSFGLANGAIQVRISEALTILPFFTPAAIPGLAVGCFLSNLLTGCPALDIIFGTLATLLGALGSYYLRRYKYLVVLPPIIANTIIIPFVLKAAYVDVTDAIPYLMLTIGIGEIISIGIIGTILLTALLPLRNIIFKAK
ncbi:MAG: QueT transporter family protein [bacterium]|nr:QueT transporter family protein [bacterium]